MTVKNHLFKNSRPLKYFIFSLSCVVFAVILTSCEQNPTAPNEPPKPYGYQEDIYWPSLADSPWPMNHHDPQSTGRSKYFGPSIGTIEWIVDSVIIMSSISIGIDSSIYLPSQSSAHNGFFSFSPKGELNWKLSVPEDIIFSYDVSTPLAAADGTIYFTGGLYGAIYAINPNGSIKWEFHPESSIYQTGINLGLDGTIYFITVNKELFALDHNGGLKWTFKNDDFFSGLGSVLSFSPDGRTLYILGKSISLYSFDIQSQSINWTFGTETLYAAPIVDDEGNIYIQSASPDFNNGINSLFCLKPDGSVKWSFAHNNPQMDQSYGYAEGTIDKLGNIYFAFDTLYSLNYLGQLNWKIPLNGFTASPLICDANGTVYISVSTVESYALSEIIAVDSDGNFLWKVPISSISPLGDVLGLSPALNNDRRLFVPTFKQYRFFVIK
ncbi:MAG: PQQ-like beta-propeller repeat protein [Ignavibacteriales bacterium]|nr:PQQ-like beta-propeller repeat protein [Ignavibacteriales bacterium]